MCLFHCIIVGWPPSDAQCCTPTMEICFLLDYSIKLHQPISAPNESPILLAGFSHPHLVVIEQVKFLGNFGPLSPMWSYNALTAGSVTAITVTADGTTVYDSDAVG